MTKRHTPRRLILTAALAAALLGGAALPAHAAPAAPAAACASSTVDSHRNPARALPPVNEDGLATAIAGLPDDGATAAFVRVKDVNTGQDFAGASGVRDRVSGHASDVDDKVRIGSVTKVFNTAIVLQLVAEGRVELDRPVQEYLPGLLPADYPPVLVGQLLNFTSGLPSPQIEGSETFEWQYAHRFDRWTPEAYVAKAVENPMVFAPGTRQQYVNINTAVSGMLIEKVTGSTWEKQVQQRIAKPLGLRDTYAPGDRTGIKGRHQNGYQAMSTEDGLAFVDVTEWNVSDRFASGDMISTTRDLQRFTTALFAGQVVPKPQLENMFTVPAVPVYDGNDDPCDDQPATRSMGLKRDVLPDGTEVWGKTGARPGYVNGVGATKDGSRVIVYMIGGTDAKGEDAHPRMMPIILAAMGY